MESKELINEIKVHNWRKRGKWHHNTLSCEIYGEGESTESSERLGYKFKRSRGLWLDTGELYDLIEEWSAIKKKVKDGYNKDPRYIIDYGNKCLEFGEKLISFSRKTGRKDFSKLGNSELAKEYVTLIARIKEFIPFVFSMQLVDEFLTEKFKELLEKHYKNISKNEMFQRELALTLPFKKIYVSQEKEDLMMVAIKKKDIKQHIKKYSWMNAILLEAEPYLIDYYEGRIKSLSKIDIRKELKRIRDEEKELKEKQKKYMEEINNDKEFFNITKTVQIFGFLRSFSARVRKNPAG